MRRVYHVGVCMETVNSTASLNHMNDPLCPVFKPEGCKPLIKALENGIPAPVQLPDKPVFSSFTEQEDIGFKAPLSHPLFHEQFYCLFQFSSYQEPDTLEFLQYYYQ